VLTVYFMNDRFKEMPHDLFAKDIVEVTK